MGSNVTALALFGGEPLVRDHRSLRIDWPIVDADDRAAVLAAFDRRDFSGRSSDEVYALESEMAAQFAMPLATGLSSATAALHAALFSFGIGAGDEVIVPNLTFIACAMAVIHAGALPVFADIDMQNHNISVETIARCITSRTKAVIVVHMHGIPAQIDEICKYCHSESLIVIEDVAQAPGATYNRQPVGSYGDASVFSLMAQKNIATCGECGVLLSRTEREKNRAEMLRIYGEILKPGEQRVYNSHTIGYNYTLNPLQAAMARTQLRKYPELCRRIQVAGERMNELLTEFSWIKGPKHSEDAKGVFHFYRMTIQSDTSFGVGSARFRRAVQTALDAEGLNVRHYQNVPLCWQPVFRSGRFSSQHAFAAQTEVTQEVIRSSFILGAIGSSPSYLLCEGTLAAYVDGLRKVQNQLDRICEYARTIDYQEPWDGVAVTSDSFRAVYEAYDAEDHAGDQRRRTSV